MKPANFTDGAYYWARYKFCPSGKTLSEPMIVQCTYQFNKPYFQRCGCEELIRLADLAEIRGPIEVDDD